MTLFELVLLSVVGVIFIITWLLLAIFEPKPTITVKYKSTENICDACGENPKAPNSQICKECERKAYGVKRD